MKWIALLAALVPLAPGTPLVNGGSPATWSPTGAMRAAHYKHTATLLPNGLVLVAGGAAIGAPPPRPELYHPRTGTWAVTGRMHGLHALATATLLRDGTVLVAGGSFGSPTAEVYDPRSGAWTATGPMHALRTYHTATLLPNGDVLVAGGLDALLTPCPAPSSMIRARGRGRSPAPCTPPGGCTRRHCCPTGWCWWPVARAHAAISPALKVYDPRRGTWTPTSPMHTAYNSLTATRLRDGTVLVAGLGVTGSTASASGELYHPRTGAWTTTGPMPCTCSSQTATLLANGMVLIVCAPAAALYNPRTGAWRATASMPGAPLQSYTATLLPNGQVLVAGGSNGRRVVSSAELYTPARPCGSS